MKINKLYNDSKVPKRNTSKDAGVDLCYYGNDTILKSGERKTLPTGIRVILPEGHAGLIWPRSGLSHKWGIDVLAGVIDNGYRGEIGVVLLNTGKEDYTISNGERIAQLIVQKVNTDDIEEITNEEFQNECSERGDKGFGSSGKV